MTSMVLDLDALKSMTEYHRKDLREFRGIADETTAKIAGLNRKQLSTQFLQEQASTFRRDGAEKARRLYEKNFTGSRLSAAREAKRHWSTESFLSRARMTKGKAEGDMAEDLAHVRWALVTSKLTSQGLADELDRAIDVEAWAIVNAIRLEAATRHSTGNDAALSELQARLISLRPREVQEAQVLIAETERLDEWIGYAMRSVNEGIEMDVGRQYERAAQIQAERTATVDQQRMGEQRGH